MSFEHQAPTKFTSAQVLDSTSCLMGLLDAAPDAIVLVDAKGKIRVANTQSEILFGYNRADLEGCPVEMLMPKRHSEAHCTYRQDYATEPRLRAMGIGLHVYAQRKDGSEFPAEISLSPMATPQGILVISIIRDVTEQRRREYQLEAQQLKLQEANLRLEELATHDGLTGLKNHRALDERLADEWRRAMRYQTPLSVVMLDLDRFKQYNYEFGHLAGDEALKQVAYLLSKTARDTDFVARFGGEEFVIVLPLTEHCGAATIAERFRVAIENGPWPKRALTASVGVSTFVPTLTAADPLTDGNALLALADSALYQSKNKGRNCVTQAHETL